MIHDFDSQDWQAEEIDRTLTNDGYSFDRTADRLAAENFDSEEFDGETEDEKEDANFDSMCKVFGRQNVDDLTDEQIFRMEAMA